MNLRGCYADPVVMRYISTRRRGPRSRARGRAGGAALRFHEHRPERIISVIRPDNVPSRRVMEKLGVICQGMQAFREVEAVWYALDRTAWERSPAAGPSTLH